ncbi:MAG: Fpg/Nei family DNA glycosylase [Ilumatobacteraceae bacterium]
MPEGLEAEIFRLAIEPTVGRRIDGVWVDEQVAEVGLAAIATGTTIEGVRRAGKVVLVDTDGPTIGLHLGMTGRIVVDGAAPIDRLEYSSGRDRPEWDRLRIRTTPGVDGTDAIRMNDPRRLGRISVDPDLSRLGPDSFGIRTNVLRDRLVGRRIAIKAALLDQSVVAGLGNMLADEVLWWSGIDPRRPAGELAPDEVAELAAVIRRRLPVMLRRGGSHTGMIGPAERADCPPCRRDGTPLRRTTIGGRTAVWCPGHQR